jgi:hypothetical protein
LVPVQQILSHVQRGYRLTWFEEPVLPPQATSSQGLTDRDKSLTWNIKKHALCHICRHVVTYVGCIKKSFTTLKAYVNLFRGHVQCFELS